MMSACITIALFLGFIAAWLIEKAGFETLTPYADSIILLILAVGLLPVPAKIVLRAMREVFIIAPEELHRQVRNVVKEIVAEYGFLGYESYVAKIGRMNMVEIHILVAENFVVDISFYDAVRSDVAKRLGPNFRLDEWLDISFTAKAEWM